VGTYETLAESVFGITGFRFIGVYHHNGIVVELFANPNRHKLTLCRLFSSTTAINMFITAYGASKYHQACMVSQLFCVSFVVSPILLSYFHYSCTPPCTVISYLLIIKQSFGTLIFGDDETLIAAGQDPVLLKRAALFAITGAIALPLSCKRDMADLAQTSKLNVFIDTTLVALVAYNAPFMQSHAGIVVEADGTVHEKHYNMWIHTNTIFVGLGVLSFAFVCQHSAFIIAGSLENPTAKRWAKVTGGSLTICAVLALFCGITGYLGYRENTKGNILENLDATGTSANIARGMLSTTMLFVYPLESFVTRHVLIALFFSGRAAHEGEDSQILSRRDRRIGLTTVLYIMAVVPAALASDLGSVLAITGAIGGSCLAYIGPGVVFLGVHGERFLQLVQQAWRSDKNADTSTSIEEGINLISAGTPEKPAVAVETTPLVAAGTNSSENDETEMAPVDENFVVHGIWNNITWYLLGMPLWCAIAKRGKARLQEHVHDLALKSPHPIRIGDVEYSKMIVRMSGKEDLGARLKQMYRENSLPLGSSNSLRQGDIASYSSDNLMASGSEHSFQNINQKIGQGLLNQQKSAAKKLTKKGLEEDPQDALPSWLDFYIAICFFLLGIVALVAGIGSIFMESN